MERSKSPKNGRARIPGVSQGNIGPGQGQRVVSHLSYPDGEQKYIYGAPPSSYAIQPMMLSPDNGMVGGNAYALGSQVIPVHEQPRRVVHRLDDVPEHVLLSKSSVRQPGNYLPVVVQNVRGVNPGDHAVCYVSPQTIPAAPNAHYAASPRRSPHPSTLPYASAPINMHAHASISDYDRSPRVVHMAEARGAVPIQNPQVIYLQPGERYDAQNRQIVRESLPFGSAHQHAGIEHSAKVDASRKHSETPATRYVQLPQEHVQVVQGCYGPTAQPPSVSARRNAGIEYWPPVVRDQPYYVQRAVTVVDGRGELPVMIQQGPLRRRVDVADAHSVSGNGSTRAVQNPKQSQRRVEKKPPKRKKSCNVESCEKYTQGGTRFCIAHGGGRRCKRDGCPNSANSSTSFCISHGGGKRCNFPECKTSARGNTRYCINHGGGRRCSVGNCNKAALSFGNTCKEHGGGRRCACFGCSKTPRSRTAFCVSHGGGKRCTFDGCSKSAVGRTDTCIQHGGGKRCYEIGCAKSAILPGNRCVAHGGGRRCQEPGCHKAARSALRYCRKCSTQRAKYESEDSLRLEPRGPKSDLTKATKVSEQNELYTAASAKLPAFGNVPMKMESSELPEPKRLKSSKDTAGDLSKVP